MTSTPKEQAEKLGSQIPSSHEAAPTTLLTNRNDSLLPLKLWGSDPTKPSFDLKDWFNEDTSDEKKQNGTLQTAENKSDVKLTQTIVKPESLPILPIASNSPSQRFGSFSTQRSPSVPTIPITSTIVPPPPSLPKLPLNNPSSLNTPKDLLSKLDLQRSSSHTTSLNQPFVSSPFGPKSTPNVSSQTLPNQLPSSSTQQPIPAPTPIFPGMAFPSAQQLGKRKVDELPPFIKEPDARKRLLTAANFDKVKVIKPETSPFRSLDDAWQRLYPYHLFHVPSAPQSEENWRTRNREIMNSGRTKLEQFSEKFDKIIANIVEKTPMEELLILEKLSYYEDKVTFDHIKNQAQGGSRIGPLTPSTAIPPTNPMMRSHSAPSTSPFFNPSGAPTVLGASPSVSSAASTANPTVVAPPKTLGLPTPRTPSLVLPSSSSSSTPVVVSGGPSILSFSPATSTVPPKTSVPVPPVAPATTSTAAPAHTPMPVVSSTPSTLFSSLSSTPPATQKPTDRQGINFSSISSTSVLGSTPASGINLSAQTQSRSIGIPSNSTQVSNVTNAALSLLGNLTSQKPSKSASPAQKPTKPNV